MTRSRGREGSRIRVDLAHEPDFAIGTVQVRPALREILGSHSCESVEPRVMQLLVALARAKGEVLSRDDLIECCWDGVIVGEDAINRCVRKLRNAAEASGNVFSIETLPRVGYRLRWPDVNSRTPSQTGNAVAPEHSPQTATSQISIKVPPRLARTVHPKGWLATATIITLGLAATGFGLWHFWPTPPQISAAPAEASIAVLPFVNMSSDPRNEYFSDGFSEQLINDLANVPDLRVASRTSSFAFKGRNEDIESIARALRVHAIVEGSVRQSGDRVRVTAQLINGSDGYHRWSATYDRNLTDILSLQDELARAIATALMHRLVPAPAEARPKIDPGVYRLYLEGIRQFDMPQPQGSRAALVAFEQVTARAPNFADGFAWLARVAFRLAVNDTAPASDLAIASDAAQRALSLEPHNMMSRTARELIELYVWNWRAAGSDLRILAQQNPNSYFLISGLWNYYTILGFPDEGLAVWRRLNAIEPQTYSNSEFTLQALDLAGRFQEEIDTARAQLVHRPGDTQRLASLCEGYAFAGQIGEAREVNERLRKLQTNFDSQVNFQNCEWLVYWATGDRVDASRLLRIWESEFPDKLAHATALGADYELLGDYDKASEWFERAYERREPPLFQRLFSIGGPYEKALAQYSITPGYRALTKKPLFQKWQAEHDRIADALAAHRDPLSPP